jgi:hypothetical protein
MGDPVRCSLLFPIFVLVLSACCPRPWDAQPMEAPPDEQCRVGESTHGYDLYLWDCVENDDGEPVHVVVSFYSSEMSCDYPEKTEVPCGETTELEDEFADQLGENCVLPPESLRWE